MRIALACLAALALLLVAPSTAHAAGLVASTARVPLERALNRSNAVIEAGPSDGPTASAPGVFLSRDPSGYRDSVNLYAFAGNDPVNHRDPSGKSTWIEQDGAVKDVKNDGDLSIYVVMPSGQMGPSKKVGETMWWDSFKSPETQKPQGIIYLDQSVDRIFDVYSKMALPWSEERVAWESNANGYLDMKARIPGHEGKSYHGFKFKGKFISLRDLGNILAGYNAASHGIPFDEFQRLAGALEQGGASAVARSRATGETFGPPPMYGERSYQYERSLYGFNLVPKPDFIKANNERRARQR